MQGDSPQVGHSDYLDFELEIGLGRGREYPVAVLDSPAGEARATMHFPLDQLALENRLLTLQNALLRSGGIPRRTLSPEEQGVQDFGRELFETLFPPDVRSCYDVSLREADQQRKGLRLKLRIHPPELAVLPWEYLYHPSQAEYVSLSTRTPIVRYLEVPQRIQPLTVAPPLRILGMIADPSELPRLDITREKQRIERAVRDLQARGLVDLTWLRGQSWRDLQRAMRLGSWHIFHFIGHGGFDRNRGEGLIVLANREGKAAHFDATRLGRLLADHSSLRLVLLNSCESARGSEHDIFSSTAAILVRRGIPAVLAMQYEITDQAAIEFARAFYEAIGDGVPVDGAVAEARKAISFAVTNTVEWGTPVLYMRSPDGMLFHMTEMPRGAPPSPAEPRPPPQVEAEQKQQLEQLYTAGLSAFWLEEWDEASRHFRAILESRPDYQDAADKLAEAQRQQRWSELYGQAQAAREAEDWQRALSILRQLVAEKPDYRDGAALLELAGRRKRLADHYAEARHLYRAGQWQAVVNLFARIAALDSDYPDPDELLPAAKRAIEKEKRQAKLNDLYSRAVREMDAGQWENAYQLLGQVQGMEVGYRETARLLAKVKAEITAQKKQAALAQPAASPKKIPAGKSPLVPILAGTAALLVLLLGGLLGLSFLKGRGDVTPGPSALPVVMATTVAPTVELLPTATILPTGWISPTGEATTAPVVTLAASPTLPANPTVTLAPTPATPLEPMNTPVPAAGTKEPTNTPQTAYLAPTLIEPAPDAELRGEVTFTWNYHMAQLGLGNALQVLIWRAGEIDHFGAAEYVRTLEQTIHLDYVPKVTSGGPGEYFWSVVVVRESDGKRLSEEATPRRFIYTGAQSPSEGAKKTKPPGATQEPTPEPPP